LIWNWNLRAVFRKNQREQLIDLLDPGPKGNVDIFCVMGDGGSELTAKQLEEILTADGWKTNGVAQSAFSESTEGSRFSSEQQGDGTFIRLIPAAGVFHHRDGRSS
jgi:hypothetical protein